ncbi:MAG: 30S ribosomal protein S9 [candidate division TM6 bacterium GW2011_GWE2_42_60]|nr:MAG: 30S ribosomal protein S9 [candidate division TM6 bacterium GW2011_GWE2_42_60]HBY05989.1 30S ribosomal protein S9 [Candidatus Dependentiae bacterium]
MSAVKTEKATRTTKAKTAGSTSKAAPKKAEKAVKTSKVESTEVVKATKSVAKVTDAETVVKAPKKAAAPKLALLGQGTGRRKSSVARVFLRLGKGEIVVNKLPYEKYFDTDIARLAVKGLINTIPDVARYDVLATVQGGGSHGQADALKLGIARALLQANPELKPTLRSNGFLTVDARLKERKKFGRKAARRGFQFVKR